MMEPSMEQYVNKTQGDYYSSITKKMINGKTAYELKGKFLDDLRNNAFSGTNGEDSIKHIENFLKIVDPLDLPNVNYERIRLVVFPISLTGNASEWLINEPQSSIATWVDLTDKFFGKCYPPSRTGKIMGTKAKWDSTNVVFENWIKSDIFNFETPLCTTFNEFNYLLKIDTDLFTHDIQEAKTYEEYKNEWLYKLNNDVPWDPEEPWSENGVPYEFIDHICEPFRFKNGKTKWPTCSLNDDGFCNEGELPGMVRVGYMTYFQDYNWYNDLIDGNLKKEALKQKVINERSWEDANPGVINFCVWLKRCFDNFHELDYELLVKLKKYWWKINDHECSPFTNWRNHIRGTYANTNIDTNYNPYQYVFGIFNNHAGRNDEETIREERELNNDHGIGNFNNDLVRDSTPYHVNEEEEQYEKDRCELLGNLRQEPPVCKIGRTLLNENDDFGCYTVVSTSTHPIIVPSDYNVEDAFSSTHSPNYTPASPDYFPASPGNTSPNPSDDLSKYLLASLAILPFYDDSYMKVMQAYNATINESHIPPLQAHIAPPTILPPSLKRARFLSSSSTNPSAPPHVFEIGESSHKTHLESHEEQIETILNHLDELPLERIEHMEDKIEGLEQIRHDDEIVLASFRTSTLEILIQDIQVRHRSDMNSLLDKIRELKNHKGGPPDY
ncbi:hypothetical protein Tco_1105834 [Tanacetum coccineum]